MKGFLKNNLHFLWILYLFIYLPWFMWLEKKVTVDFFDITIPLDHKIPFCEYFVIPYYGWFFFVAFTWIFLAFVNKKEFYQFIGTLYTGMTIFLIISTVFPNGQTLRIPLDPEENFCTWLVYQLRLKDTPTNVFPSLHVYNSLVCCHALRHCKKLESYKTVRFLILIFSILICLSTMFLKQHSIVDVVGAIVLFGVLFPIFNYWLPKHLK